MLYLDFADGTEGSLHLNITARLAIMAELERQGEDAIAARLAGGEGETIEPWLLESFVATAPAVPSQPLFERPAGTDLYTVNDGPVLSLRPQEAADAARRGLTVEASQVDRGARGEQLWLRFVRFAADAVEHGGIVIT